MHEAMQDCLPGFQGTRGELQDAEEAKRQVKNNIPRFMRCNEKQQDSLIMAYIFGYLTKTFSPGLYFGGFVKTMDELKAIRRDFKESTIYQMIEDAGDNPENERISERKAQINSYIGQVLYVGQHHIF